MIRAARTLFLVALSLLLVLLGFAAGRTAADLAPSGVDAAAVAVVEHGAAAEWADSPISLVRTGGERIVRINDAYVATTIDAQLARTLFLSIARDAAGWADHYPMAGAVDPETTVLRIWGAHPRTIRIESLVTNPDVPASLLATVGTLIRTENLTPGTPFIPAGIRLTVQPSSETGGEPLFEAPPFEVGTADGRYLTWAEAGDLAKRWPPLSSIRPAEAHAFVRDGGAIYRIGWTADWASWISAGSR